MPVMPHPAPVWVDPTSALAVAAPQPIHYFPVAHPASQLPPKQPPAAHDPPLPRPRKPYTTTKVREMWSPSEHQRMLEGLRLFKRDWAKVTEHVGTRSTAQVRSHAQKYFDKVAREKTDDYVPRARPKRKSATPYPRKVREQPPVSANLSPHPNANPSTHTATSTPPVSPAHAHTFAVPVQQLHPAMAAAHAVHPAPMHVQYAAQPSSFIPQLQPSRYVAHPQPQIAVQQHPSSPAVFSPYLNVYPTQSPSTQRPNFEASVQPSPVSFVSGHTYTAQSPVPQPQHMSVTHPVFNVFSPLTPGTYTSTVARSPSVAHAPTSILPIAQVQQSIPPHAHVHTHAGGPLASCAKCNALRRYGGVLQEIVQIGSHPLATPQVVHSSQPSRWRPHDQIHQKGSKLEQGSNTTKLLNQATDSTACATAQEQSASTSDKKSVDDSLPSFKDIKKTTAASPTPAKSRAHRSKFSKSRKMASNRVCTGHEDNNVSSGEMSESDNFSRIKTLSMDTSVPDRREEPMAERKKQTTSSVVRSKKRKGFHCASSGLTAKKHHDGFQRRLKKTKCVPIAPSPIVANSFPKRPRTESLPKPVQPVAPSGNRIVEENGANRTVDKQKDETVASVEAPSPKSPKLESESDVASPGVETYSPKERKEIFDAVHSLQILSRSPSSSSPSQSDSKGGSEDGN